MSAEQLVENIINNAIATAEAKSDSADRLARDAKNVSGRSAGGHVTPPPLNMTVRNGDPGVNIPKNATGVDSALYNSTQNKIIQDLSDKFTGFFATYFPNECNALAEAQRWMCDVLTEGGTGIKPHVEDQIWQRERARTLSEVRRASEEVLSTFAARGFPLPPGAANHAMQQAQQEAQDKIAASSRDRAIKQAEMEIENIKFVVQQALDYRVKGIAAAAEYMKTLALGPDIAMKLATSAADAQAKLISSAASYYSARNTIAQIEADLHKTAGSLVIDAGRIRATSAQTELTTESTTIASLAQAMGSQAAAALNAVHASAGVAVQGETG